MLYRINVGLKPHIQDVQGQSVARGVERELNLPVHSIRLIKVYTLDGLTEPEAEAVMQASLLSDPVLHRVSMAPLAEGFDWNIEIGFKPGVTDNEGRIAQESIRCGLSLDRKRRFAVYTAVQYLIEGDLDETGVRRIATEYLANELIEQYRFKSRQDWSREPGFPPVAPRVTGKSSDQVDIVTISGMSEIELEALSRERVLAMSLAELKAIQEHFARPDIRSQRETLGLPPEPTDAELEVLAQTWSEHCKHKIFNALIDYRDPQKGKRQTVDSLFSTYIQRSTSLIRQRLGDQDFCLSVFRDNAGVIRFDEDYSLCMKVETHNSPSALDPYGGALTGIVGVNRDPMGTGLGANLLCNTDVFCFASPFHDEPLPPRLLHPHRVLEGVRKGVEHGGNQSGIPTVNGGLVFDERFLGKPLVFCGTVGMLPAEIQGKPSHEKKAEAGDAIVMVGGRVGKDGIHGATFSSEALHAGSPATAVQIGDPITQRKMYDFLMRARDMGLYRAITDNGAGGLSSSVGEMAEDSGGCLMDLSRVPLKYDGLLPWEILLSEAQERMTLAVPQESLTELLTLAGEMDVEATPLGRFTDSGFFKVSYGDKPVADLDMGFLHHGLPRMRLEAVWEPPEQKELHLPEEAGRHRGRLLKRMLGRLNICSREYIIRQYDHEVQGGSVIKPLVGQEGKGPGDAAVIRPILDKERGFVVSNGICPKLSDLDTYWMMACAVDEAIRNAVAVGANPDHMAGVDNFCWCDPVQSEKTPDGRYKLAQLVRANQALSHYCLGFGVPCISGKDSMKNDYTMQGYKISIPPTVLFSVISVIPRVEACLTSDFKRPGDLLFLLGQTRCEMGGSELAAELGLRGGAVPQVDLLAARRRYRSVYQAVASECIAACHDLSDGGLAVAAAEMAIGGGLGAELDLQAVPAVPKGLSPEEVLYSESPSRLLACVPQEKESAFRELFAGQTLACLGRVTQTPRLQVRMGQEPILDEAVDELRQAWEGTFDW